jgi:hypothetical protein
MSKKIEPPIEIKIKMPIFNEEEESHNKKVWDSLMQKDIKQEMLKVSVQYKKSAKGNRHRSLNSQKSCESK